MFLRLLDFDTKGHDIFRRWYVDGRLYYHKVIDKNNPRMGIVDLRYIEPRKIRKVREMQKELKNGSSVELSKKVEEYYIYNEKGYVHIWNISRVFVISPDSITYCPSGLVDAEQRSCSIISTQSNQTSKSVAYDRRCTCYLSYIKSTRKKNILH